MIKEARLTPAMQLYGLLARFPQSRGRLSNHGRRLVWVCEILPHPLCGRYLIEVRLAQDGLPEVLVISPDLHALAGERTLPHTFSPVDGRPSLCLWWQHDWNRSMSIANTIVPWAAEWFWFFEHWLVTGEWLGGGSHPIPITPPGVTAEPQRRSA